MSADRQETREERLARIRDQVSRPGRLLTRKDLPPLKPGEESLWDALQKTRDAFGTFDFDLEAEIEDLRKR